MRIYRYPEYRETVKAVTWSRQIKGVKGFREFEVYAGDEKLAAASSIWIFVDACSKKIKRVPKDMSDMYTEEPDVALNPELDSWKINNNFSPEMEVDVSTRYFDYDPMGHVNNSVFVQYH